MANDPDGRTPDSPGDTRLASALASPLLYERSDVYDGPTTERLAALAREQIERLGEDPEREGLVKTPERVAKAMQFLTHGYGLDPDAILRSALFEEDYSEMVLVRDIELYSLCVPGRQLVNGVRGATRAADVCVGDELWTLAEGRVVPTTVTGVTSRTTRDLVEVVTSEGTVQVTPDHPFATPNGWVEAQHLEGLSVEWTPPKQLCRTRFAPTIGRAFGYALGAICSDGTVAPRYVSLVVNDRAFAERFAASVRDAFGLDASLEAVSRPSGCTGKDTPGFRVRIVSSLLADLCRHYVGGDAHHMRQRFPRIVLESQETFEGFLDGYVDGDGFRSKSSSGRFVISGNVPFLEEMAVSVGARFTPRPDLNAARLYIADSWSRKHGFKQEDHNTSLSESSWVRVDRVTPRKAAGKKPFTVYSFSCDPHPTFLIGGHLSHNCEHHMLPFFGKAHVAYIPQGRIVGLSKIPRVVDVFARRLQVQERLTLQIRDAVDRVLRPEGVAVVIEAQHLCMMMRGAEKQASHTTTSAMSGVFLENSNTRAEFMRLIRG